MKKTLLSLTTAAVLGLAASSASAEYINVGGVVWDPASITSLPQLIDFNSNGTVFETFAGQIGDEVTGYGKVEAINSAFNNTASFCPGCELTFTFTMTLASATFNSPVDAAFSFDNLLVNVFVDHTPDYIGTFDSAKDGALWLSLAGHGALTGSGKLIGTGSDQGSGSSLLDVTGGLAESNFDTNTKADGSDMVFTSSFQPLQGVPGLLTGNVQLTGNSIPEPGSLALIGLGLLGLSLGRRKAKA